MIEFVLNHKKITTEAFSGENLLYFIRETAHLKGTKVGCREGDCGACTVLVGTLQENGKVFYQSVTSCLTSLASIEGKHIVTIEGLNLENQLNKAQGALHENFATQCGFCTPGFAVSLAGVALEKHDNHRNTIDAVSGNICRCTGYKSIENAVSQFDKEIGIEPHSLDWYIENNFIPKYFNEIPGLLKTLKKSNIAEKQRLVAGGTDLYVKEADHLSDLNIDYFEGFDKIKIENGICNIGSGVTVSQLWDSPELNSIFPKLKMFLKLISSKPIRNMATIAGNFVNASPIGDLSIFFLALDAKLTINNKQNVSKKVDLKYFFKDYKKVDLLQDEWIESVDFQVPTSHFYFNFEKVSKRTYLDIASVNSAICFSVENAVISNVHASIGGVSAIPKYLEKTSRFLEGKLLSIELIKDASKILQEEIAPINDIRGSEKYKRLLARQLFLAHFIELFPSKFKLSDFL